MNDSFVSCVKVLKYQPLCFSSRWNMFP